MLTATARSFRSLVPQSDNLIYQGTLCALFLEGGREMTIQEAFEETQRMEPNTYTVEDMIGWLSQLDMKIWREIFLTHERQADAPEDFKGYSAATDPTTELLVKEPDAEEIYINYLKAMVDKSNMEIGKYNQNITAFNDAYNTFANWYTRTHMPLQAMPHFLF